jgi:hypothetical protein
MIAVAVAGGVLLWVPYSILSICDQGWLAGSRSALEVGVQTLMATAVAVTAIITLANADPAKLQVCVKQKGTAGLQTDAQEPRRGHPAKYERKRIPPERQGPFQEHKETFYSYRVKFTLSNASGFTLKRPRVTIAVPADRRHPTDPEGPSWKPTCNASFGVTIGPPQAVHTEDRFRVTAVLADDWWPEAEKEFWIRLVLDDGPGKPFALEVTVTCEGAEGTTLNVPVPDDLVSSQKAIQR